MLKKYFNSPFIFLKKKANHLEFDSSVFYGVLLKLWTILTGPIIISLISLYFSEIEQGYYYTFSSLLGLQIFIEMGIGSVIQQFSSHEWANLRFNNNGEIIGDADSLSRLISIGNISLNWFLKGSIFLILLLSIGGSFFFNSEINDYNWFLPWLILCLTTGVYFIHTPILSILEGCNQVKQLYKFRFFQGIVVNISVWVAIILGAGIWATVVSSFVSIFCIQIFIKKTYFKFFKNIFIKKTLGPKINWRMDMFSMQWKVALSWISGYFSFFIFTPILFKFQGPEIAGKFGMSWSIIGLVGGIALAWLSPKIPKFAILASQKKYFELDKLFWKIVKIVCISSTLLAVFLLIIIHYLSSIENNFISSILSRIIPMAPFSFFLFGQVFVIVSVPFSSYMRSHKKEPLTLISIIQSLMIATSTYYFSNYYSLYHVALAYMLINISILPIIIIIWRNFNQKLFKGDLTNE